ncbi:Dynactin subunit 4 [Eumeta japonica]|uniref:Dynactin subunit 4 n=1 Tax=Eumeta variegata TaxID=151549 RepID=A0A4C1T4L8_EUMVA|nr:Dynactin subunit 4 [Eumeta japonica]
MHFSLSDNAIEEILQQEDSEEEIVSETEDHEEFSDHDSNFEQEADPGDIVDVPLRCEEDEEPVFPMQFSEEYLEDVPLKYIKRKKFIGRNGKSQWFVQQPPQNVRTRSYNIITHLPGPVRAAKECTNILDAWNLIFPDEYLHKIVDYTNIYIENLRRNYSRDRDCKDTDIIELRALFGVLYFCGRMRNSHLNTKDIWALDGSGYDWCIASMSRQRFHFLLKCLRFDNMHTREERRAEDKFAPFREIFEDFNVNIKRYYSFGENITIDEKLEKFRGRCPFRQYIPSKPGKYGIKIFVMADAQSFYTGSMEVYIGQNDGPYQQSNAAIDVVKRLVEPIKNTHRNVVMDNWFTNFPLFHDLLKEYGLTALGTVKKNKPEIPPVFTVAKYRDIPSSIFGFQKDCTLVSYVPKNNKVVLLASTMHHDGKKDSGEAKKPEMILDYNRSKCGVDVVDELCGTYSVSRITKRWPLVIFYGLLNVGGINAYVIVKANKEYSGATIGPRTNELKELANGLMMPLIQRRMYIVNLPQVIKINIKLILGLFENNDHDEPSSSKTRPKPSTSRCEDLTSMPQRLAAAEWQPPTADRLHPLPKMLSVKRSQRCRACDHNLTKPEYNPGSIKFKIELLAYYHVPEVKIISCETLKPGARSMLLLKLTNPTGYEMKLRLLSPEDIPEPEEKPIEEETELKSLEKESISRTIISGFDEPLKSNVRIEAPTPRLALAQRDDAAEYDDDAQNDNDHKDLIMWRKSNKLAIRVPLITDEAAENGAVGRTAFALEYTYRNTVPPSAAQPRQPHDHTLYTTVILELGTILT